MWVADEKMPERQEREKLNHSTKNILHFVVIDIESVPLQSNDHPEEKTQHPTKCKDTNMISNIIWICLFLYSKKSEEMNYIRDKEVDVTGLRSKIQLHLQETFINIYNNEQTCLTDQCTTCCILVMQKYIKPALTKIIVNHI